MATHDYAAEKVANTTSNTTTTNLERQITMSLSPDQYERLFLQPSSAKGDLAKRLGNPSLLGILGFLIPFTATTFALVQFQGSSVEALNGFSGSFLFLGGISMVLAGIFEFILGNTFPMTVFITYGCHWVVTGYNSSPLIGIVQSYAVDGIPGTLSQEYNASQGHYFVAVTLVSCIFLAGSLRINVPFVLIFFGLVFEFAFLAAGYYHLSHNLTAAGGERAFYLFKIGGGFGFITMIMGWYLAIIQVCASTGVPCPLPVFDLSQRVFAHSVKGQQAEHAGVITKEDSSSA